MSDYIKSINGYPVVMANAAYFGTSGTYASTAEKAVLCSNMQALENGTTITVRFSNSSTLGAALTLNVNSLGAKPIRVNGSATSESNMLLWGSGAVITFVYDGWNWNVVSEPRCWYGTSSTSAGTSEKTSTITGVVICAGTRITLGMTSANTATSPTLNVSLTLGRNIYYGTGSNAPTTANGYGWAAGDTVGFVFDGAYWRLADTVALTKLNAQ